MNLADAHNSAEHHLQTALSSVGFDVCHPFHPKRYNKCIQKNQLPLQPLPDTGLAYLIGNTKRFWPIFLQWWRTKQSDAYQHPVDSYIRESISNVLAQTFGDTTSHKVFWSDEYSMDRLVSMQRVASCSGLAYLDEITHLTVHPVYGTWHSFRAVVVVDTNNGSFSVIKNKLDNQLKEQPSVTLPCLLTREEQDKAKIAMEKAVAASDMDNICNQLHGGMTSETTAAAWIALRDCIESRGKEEYRFDETQLWYHYTKDPKYLKAALANLSSKS